VAVAAAAAADRMVGGCRDSISVEARQADRTSEQRSGREPVGGRSPFRATIFEPLTGATGTIREKERETERERARAGEKRTGAHARSASRACARRCMNIAAYAAPDVVALRGRPACVCVSASPQAQFLRCARPVRCVLRHAS